MTDIHRHDVEIGAPLAPAAARDVRLGLRIVRRDAMTAYIGRGSSWIWRLRAGMALFSVGTGSIASYCRPRCGRACGHLVSRLCRLRVRRYANLSLFGRPVDDAGGRPPRCGDSFRSRKPQGAGESQRVQLRGRQKCGRRIATRIHRQSSATPQCTIAELSDTCRSIPRLVSSTSKLAVGSRSMLRSTTSCRRPRIRDFSHSRSFSSILAVHRVARPNCH